MKIIKTITLSLFLFISTTAVIHADEDVTDYTVIENMDLITSLAAVNVAAECGWGYQPLDLENQVFMSGIQKYTEMGIISKHVRYKFELRGSSLHMSYFNHEQEDKTRGRWERIQKLTKKDKKTFDAVVAKITEIRDDEDKLNEAIGQFFTNGNHLPTLFEQGSEEMISTFNNVVNGSAGRFIWVAFKSIEENTDQDYSDYKYKVTWTVIPQSLEVKEKFADSPTYLVHYANNQPKADKREGLFDDLQSLKPDVYPALSAKVVKLMRDDSGRNVLVVTDI